MGLAGRERLTPRGLDKVEALLDKGVAIPNPLTLDIGDEVDVARISGDRVTLHPGTRLHGADTVISAGCELGREGPVTLENCRLGPNVQLKGGYAASAVFLDGANLGLGHHVREGCLLEEEAGGAHCVGLKQTILLPFVTLGSLINFCDALMAGGTSRSDHSEVGSSYIHFNFTPSGDKTTPSLFGDVPRGVMLREHPIFLGGQGGTVGPVRVAYGSVVGAGSVLRSDVREPDTLSLVGMPASMSRSFDPSAYGAVARLVGRNLGYIAQLEALEQWYRHVRRPFFEAQPLGALVYDGALVALASARKERIARLGKLAAKLAATGGAGDPADVSAAAAAQHREFVEHVDALCAVFAATTPSTDPSPDPQLVAAAATMAAAGTPYLRAIRGLSPESVSAGTAWLQGVVDARMARCTAIWGRLVFA